MLVFVISLFRTLRPVVRGGLPSGSYILISRHKPAGPRRNPSNIHYSSFVKCSIPSSIRPGLCNRICLFFLAPSQISLPLSFLVFSLVKYRLRVTIGIREGWFWSIRPVGRWFRPILCDRMILRRWWELRFPC